VSANLQREIISDLGSFTHNPVGFVLWAYPWGVAGTSLATEDGPDVWQRTQLRYIGDALRDNPFSPLFDSTASGHGIGKSAEVCWINHWALMTHEDTRGVITANTETQLRTKTWAEMAKWHSLLQFELLRQLFPLEGTSIHSSQPGHERTWRIDAIPWSERNPEAFAGLHNAGKRIILTFDEASSIPDSIWEVAEGALTDDLTEILWMSYGNPTRNSGRFKETIAGRFRSRWTHRQIDSRTVKRTNKTLLDQWVETYGDDSDFVRVRVKGQFPRASSTQFIGTDVVDEARQRAVPEGLITDPIIFGVDCARFGDDKSVCAVRKGRDARTIPWLKWHHQDSMKVAGDIALHAERYKPDAIFIDAGNIGAAIVDRLRQIGLRNVFEVWFGSTKVRDASWNGASVKVRNKRSEIWTNLRAWLEGGAIPDDDDLATDLTGVEYGYGPDQISIELERKEDMRHRGMASPDEGDALACTFAEPVMPRVPAHRDPASYIDPGANYDRYAELR
jgi:hypothetical protein